MEFTYIILWLFFTVPWNLGGLPMTEGWYAAYAWPGGADAMAECQQAAERIIAGFPSVKPLCAPIELGEPGPVAEPRR